MGSSREEAMWKWLETHREEAKKRYIQEIRDIVNSETFSEADDLPNFFEWCMENFNQRKVL